jgi:hypothetical protein
MPRKKRTEAEEARRFGLVVAAAAAAVAGWSAFRGHPVRALALGAVALAAAGLPLVASPLWVRLFRVWMRFAEALGRVSTRVLLSVFFYVVLTPAGILSRWLRDDPLDLAWKDGKPTYWKDKDPVPETMERYEKQY